MVDTKTEDEALKSAARNYLHELESNDGDRESADKAKDHLAAVAVLWAQAEAIAKVDAKRKALLRGEAIEIEAKSADEAYAIAHALIRG